MNIRWHFIKISFGCVLFLTGFLFAQYNELQEVEKVSLRVQQLAPYAKVRTVAIKIIVGSRTGFGSGAIISPDGMILTCAHVAEIGEQITVITSEGKQYLATRLGMNRRNDYAVIKIQAKSLPYFTLGSSSDLRLLQWVVALGHPGGPYPDSQPAVATGRIRGLHKKLPIQFGVKFYDDAILTDIPIFSGNSGGPLVDLDGKLIGINGAIALVNDLAFAIPIDEIKKDLPVLAQGKNVMGRSPRNLFKIFMELQEDIPLEDMKRLFKDTPFGKIMKLLGGDFQFPTSPTPKLGLILRVNKEKRVEIQKVLSNSLAQMTGFKVKDCIVKINDKKISSISQIKNYLKKIHRGDQVTFVVWRKGKPYKISVIFSRKAYSRERCLKRAFVYHGLELMESTVKVYADGQRVGYGVIFSPKGWVLTNHQILGNAQNFLIQLQGSTNVIYPAELVGRDGVIDVALLKFTPDRKLKAIPLGSDLSLKIGEWVISGGNESGAIQVGMVSALRRFVPPNRKIPVLGVFGIPLFGKPNKSEVRAYPQVIQHDSNMEEGQFGTPLVNEKGELVGINAGHFYRGTSFAIPISLIQYSLPHLRTGKKVNVPKEFQPYTPKLDPLVKLFKYFIEPKKSKRDSLDNILRDLFQSFSHKKPKKNRGGFLGIEVKQHWQGVEVVRVLSGYAADRGGLRKGDIIIEMCRKNLSTLLDLPKEIREKICKQKIHSLVNLLERVKTYPPGTEVEITVIRQARKKKLLITLDQRP